MRPSLLKRLVLVAVFLLASALPLNAEMQCYPGMTWCDDQGVQHCSVDTAGNCIICFDWIVVKG